MIIFRLQKLELVCSKILAAVQSDFDTRHWNFEDAVRKIIWPAQSYFSSFI